jgi:hypothetical protein
MLFMPVDNAIALKLQRVYKDQSLLMMEASFVLTPSLNLNEELRRQ